MRVSRMARSVRKQTAFVQRTSLLSANSGYVEGLQTCRVSSMLGRVNGRRLLFIRY
jgi:hypothetical protein